MILRRGSGWLALPVLVVLLAACAAGRMGAARLPLTDDALLLASDRDALAERLRLVEAGRYAEAERLWARRALLPATSSSLDTGEMAWDRQIARAAAAASRSRPDVSALERLARAFERARWFRETRAVLERGERLGTLSAEGRERLELARRLAALADSADALARAGAGAEGGGEAPAPVSGLRELLAATGFTVESLRTRGLHLGRRPAADGDAGGIDLAVIVEHRGPFTLAAGGDPVELRRVILDDHQIEPPPADAIWPRGLRSIATVDRGTLFVIHDRSVMRRAGVLLYRELERRGGRAPDGVETAAAGGEPAGDAAAVLRLRSAAPLFHRARAEGGHRSAIERRFLVELLEALMTSVETGAAARLGAERRAPGTTGGARGLVLSHLAALGRGPLPGFRLAELIGEVARGETGPEGEAARAVVGALRLALGGAGGEAAAIERLATLSDREIRAASAAIDGDRVP